MDFFENGIGDWFISDEQKKINESMLKDAELQRQQIEQYMKSRKAMASGTGSNQTKYIVLAGVAVLMIFTLIMFKA
jgi:hypothetical protein